MADLETRLDRALKPYKPSRSAITFLRQLAPGDLKDTSPSTGNIAKALESAGLAKSVAIYADGHHREYRHLLGFKFAITNEGRAFLRELDAKKETP